MLEKLKLCRATHRLLLVVCVVTLTFAVDLHDWPKDLDRELEGLSSFPHANYREHCLSKAGDWVDHTMSKLREQLGKEKYDELEDRDRTSIRSLLKRAVQADPEFATRLPDKNTRVGWFVHMWNEEQEAHVPSENQLLANLVKDLKILAEKDYAEISYQTPTFQNGKYRIVVQFVGSAGETEPGKPVVIPSELAALFPSPSEYLKATTPAESTEPLRSLARVGMPKLRAAEFIDSPALGDPEAVRSFISLMGVRLDKDPPPKARITLLESHWGRTRTEIEFGSFSIKGAIISVGAPLAIVLIQLFLLAQLVNLGSAALASSPARDFPWVALFPGWISRSLTLGSLAALPVVTLWTLHVKLYGYYGRAGEQLHLVDIGLTSAALVLGLVLFRCTRATTI